MKYSKQRLANHHLLVCGAFFSMLIPVMQVSGSQIFTLSFPVSQYSFNPTTQKIFVGAAQPVAGSVGIKAIAIALNDSKEFLGVTPALVTLNGSPAQMANPLFGAQIDILTLSGDLPVAVNAAQPQQVYMINSYPNANAISVISALPHDANGTDNNGIQALAGAQMIVESAPQNIVFAAVAPNGGLFGSPGSGIAYGKMNGQALVFGTSAAPFTVSSNVVPLAGSDAVSMSAPVLFFDHVLYAGCQVVAGATGARSVAVGVYQAESALLQMVPIAPDSAITSDSIIGSSDAGAQVNAYFVSIMHTSTRLPYLVVVGGVTAASTTPASVFALPRMPQGVLAAKNSPLLNNYMGQFPYAFGGQRSFEKAAKVPGDIYTSTDIPARVGGADAPGIINSLEVRGDSVFVATDMGIYYSQALFKSTGVIVGWTPWQRAAGMLSGVAGLVLNQKTGNFWYLPGDIAHQPTTTINKTLWAAPKEAPYAMLTDVFSSEQGGVQGLFDFNVATPGLNDISLICATGYQKAVITQSNNAIGSPYISTDGTLVNFVAPVSSLTFSGGVFEQLGALVAAAVVTDANNGWLVVAGTGGVAVLAHADGTGWALPTGLQTGFMGLDDSMQWRMLGKYQNVRKLCVDGNNFYVVTDWLVDRIAATTETFKLQGALNGVTVSDMSGISDFVVSGALGLLATQAGLFRTGDCCSVATALNAAQVQWTRVSMAESPGPVTRLFVISPTLLEQDFAQVAPGGNIYALAAYVGYDQARLYRFSITSSPCGVDVNTVLPFPDMYVRWEPTFFANMGNYRNYFVTDGALFTFGRSRFTKEQPFIDMLPPGYASGSIARAGLNNVLLTVKNGKTMGRLLRRSSTGAWMVGGNFGLMVNE